MLNYNKYKYHASMMQNTNYFKSVNYKYKTKNKKQNNIQVYKTHNYFKKGILTTENSKLKTISFNYKM